MTLASALSEPSRDTAATVAVASVPGTSQDHHQHPVDWSETDHDHGQDISPTVCQDEDGPPACLVSSSSLRVPLENDETTTTVLQNHHQKLLSDDDIPEQITTCGAVIDTSSTSNHHHHLPTTTTTTSVDPPHDNNDRDEKDLTNAEESSTTY